MSKNILHPNRFHGFNVKPPFFEGWYYKLVSADERSKFAIIPGVYIAPQDDRSHCFVQVFNSENNEVHYHRYPYQEFSASKETFKIQIGPNAFCEEQISLAIDDKDGALKGTVNFKGLNPWPVRFFSPGAMGWFAWVPFMETYHGVVSMDHKLEGVLVYNGIEHDFSGGCGYMEKDWGRQFPSAYIWGQSNHFEQPGVSLMLSVAVIPWLGRSFGGFIVGLLCGGRLYRFATYNQSRIESLIVDEGQVNLVVRNSRHRLRVQAQRREGVRLQAPTLVEMDRRIVESIDATLHIQFEDLDGKIIFSGLGRHAGLETVGDLGGLMGMLRR